MRNMRVYIDQNIIGYLRDGILDFSEIEKVDWIYSSEHFNEISRGGDTTFLSVLETLKAQEIELLLDGSFKMTGEAQIHAYSCPHDRFERYKESIEGFVPCMELHDPLIARLCGADNYDEVSKLPEITKREIGDMLHSVGVSGGAIDQLLEDVATGFDDGFIANLVEARSLESTRKSMGIEKGKAGQVEEANPIKEIWALIKDNCEGLKGISCDQFFGFDSLAKQTYEVESTYMGIVGCYTVLNMMGYRTDKGIAQQDNVKNIASDASHVGYAAFCDGLMSADRRLIAKAKAIYAYKGLKRCLMHVKAKAL